MIIPPRFVAVDNELNHIKALELAFHQLGTPCMGIHYKPETGLDSRHFQGVRVLFLDLHLISSARNSDNKQNFGHIAGILEENINMKGGPFVLVIWTEYDNLKDELQEYLEKNLDSSKPYARPVALLCLPKSKHIRLDTGEALDPENLFREIEKTISSNAQMAALLQWEREVVVAAGVTISSVIDLIPFKDRLNEQFPISTAKLLCRIATETVGATNVARDPYSAVNETLIQILTDRILNQERTASDKELWQSATSLPEGIKLPPLEAIDAAKLNRMIHLAIPPFEVIKVSDLGVVINFPADEKYNSEKVFDAKLSEIFRSEFQISPNDAPRCLTRLVRIGAPCDHAQNKRGSATFLLALEIPTDVKSSGRAPASLW